MYKSITPKPNRYLYGTIGKVWEREAHVHRPNLYEINRQSNTLVSIFVMLTAITKQKYGNS